MLIAKPTEAFKEFQQNLGYARQLVDGGRRLGQLQVGAFDIDDLYRAAWVQAVAALDHWVTVEIVDRAVALARQPSAVRPPKFSKLTISIDLFEQIHHHHQPIDAAFRAHLEQTFGFMTFQNPDKIKEGLAYVSTVNLWPRVAAHLSSPDDGEISADFVRTKLREIAQRRNAIAHTADRDPQNVSGRAAITADDAIETITWLERIAGAIVLALGPIVAAPDYDQPPEGADALGEAPTPTRAVLVRGRSEWDENSLIESIKNYCTPEVAATLLAVYRHAETHPTFQGYYFGEAAHPSVTAWFHMGDDEAAVWSIYTGTTRSTLSINFQWMRDRGASLERLERLANDLASLPGWARLSDTLAGWSFAKRPSVSQAALAAPGTKDTILSALGGFLSPSADD
ncbi:hypothetical protein [Actinomadura sp. 9N215]|uniref:hypothetical protein n=1 Tax=Actinomadura sp. 9N215 TaxID=3375150 RepID=UPI0037A1BA86